MIQYTKEYIANLLDKYMDGSSTIEEEDILAQYFKGKNIPEEWICYQQMFQEIEAMTPQAKPRNRWAIWGAQVDTVAQQIASPTDTVTAQPVTPAETPKQPVKPKKRSLRKSEPTIHDIDKAYALLAQAEQEKAKAEYVKAQIELFDAQMAAYGYIPVMQEDGTINYINEQENLIAYEE